MPSTTSRLALIEPLGTDAPSELRLSITNHATTLDSAVLVTEGVLASRPAASSVEHSHIYHATDTAQWYISDGTNWSIVASPDTGWVSLASLWNSGVTTASGIPSYRVQGDICRLKGAVFNGSNNTLNATALPTLARPAQVVTIAVGADTPGGASLGISTAGFLTYSTLSTEVYLDGVTYSLS